jgi:predicted small secreted protein
VSRRGGTAARRVVYRSDDEWGARIVSRDRTEPWWNHGSYVDIEGFDVTAPKARLGLVSEGSHVRIRQNRVHSVALLAGCDGVGGAGIDHAGYAGRANEITGNTVEDIGPVAGCNTIQGVYLSQSDGVIRSNTIGRVSGWCIHTWHGATRARISDNLAAQCGTVRTRSGGGILVGAGDNPPGVYASDFVVTNNTVLDSYRGIVESGRVGPGNSFSNNTLARIAVPQ